MTLVQDLLGKSGYGKKELARQDLIVSVTEQIWEALEASEMSKADLARALQTSKSNVTQLLDGTRNMTLSTLADIGGAVGAKPRVVFEHARAHVAHSYRGVFSTAVTGVSPQQRHPALVQADNAAIGKPGTVVQNPVASIRATLGTVLTVG